MSSSRSLASGQGSLKSLDNRAEVFALNLIRAEEPAPGSLNDEELVRRLVTDAIANCSKSREQIAEEMTALIGESITIRMLNSYTSAARELHRWPLQFTRAFCYVVKDWSLLRTIAEQCGFLLITREEAALLEIGAQYLRQKRASERMQALEQKLGGIEL